MPPVLLERWNIANSIWVHWKKMTHIWGLLCDLYQKQPSCMGWRVWSKRWWVAWAYKNSLLHLVMGQIHSSWVMPTHHELDPLIMSGLAIAFLLACCFNSRGRQMQLAGWYHHSTNVNCLFCPARTRTYKKGLLVFFLRMRWMIVPFCSTGRVKGEAKELRTLSSLSPFSRGPKVSTDRHFHTHDLRSV